MRAYVAAAGVSLASVALVWSIPSNPIGFLLVPVIAVAYRWKLGPGLVATGIVSLLSCWLSDPLRAFTVFVDGVFIVAMMEALHRSRAREHAARVAERTSQRRFEQLFHASPVALSLSSVADRRVLEVNEAYLDMFRVRRDQIAGHTAAAAGIEIPEPAEHDACESEFEFRAGGEPRTGVRWSRVVELDGDRYTLSTFLDVTEHKRARDALLASDERLREFVANVHEVFWITDPTSSRFDYVSPAYEPIFGRSAAALAADARDWLAAVHPGDRARIEASVARPRAEPWEDEFRILRFDGSERTIHVHLTPIRDATGEVVRIAGVAEDVTERVALEAQVRQTQKLESLGLLAGGVAHDFNNILAVIAANASLLAEVVPAHDGDGHELVEEIEQAVARATSLTRQLLAFSRKQVIEPVVLDLNAAVGDTRKMLRRMVGEDISVVTSLEPELGHVRIDPGHLVQVIMNLAVNARDAMPRGGSLTLTTRNVRRGNAREVMLVIADTGCGMSPEVKARIFEPFFTTKDAGHGTGLGLSVVHGIVEQAGGRIEVESEPGIGTELKIYLPFVDAPAERFSDVSIAGAQGSERILLVDDDMFVRAATSRALRARGYQVLEASDGHAALRLLQDHRDIALLVTDVVMPDVDGRELVEAARRRRPTLKVLYISGYTDDAVLRHGIKRAEVAILEKPFRGHALVGKVRQILDAN